MAYWLSAQGISSLIDHLHKSQYFKDKKISVVRVALGGYKQPQQLIALNYLLTLGAHFDIVVNIDGFNDIVIPVTSNLSKGVFPFFPSHWYHRVKNVPDNNILNIMGRINYLRDKRCSWSRFSDRSPLCYSVVMNLIWRFYDK